MKIILIAAVGKSGQLGFKGKIPWHISEDFKHFKATTMGHHLIMGRKTFDSIGKALPGRITIILSRNKSIDAQIPLANSIGEALLIAKKANESKLFICGGGEIYEQFKHQADEIYLSTVDFEGEADAYFPNIDYSKYDLFLEKEFKATEKSPSWDLKHYKRKN